MAKPIEAARGFLGGRWYKADFLPGESKGVQLVVQQPARHEIKARKALARATKERTTSADTLKGLNLKFAAQTTALGAGMYATGRASFWAVEKAVNEWSAGNRTLAYAEATTAVAPLVGKVLYRGAKKQLVKAGALISENIAGMSINHNAKKGERLRTKHPTQAILREQRHPK